MKETIDVKQLGSKFWAMPLALTIALAGCGAQTAPTANTGETEAAEQTAESTDATENAASENEAAEAPEQEAEEKDDGSDEAAEGEQQEAAPRTTLSDDTDEGHALMVDSSSETTSYAHVDITKTGEASGDEADFYGVNSAVFATDGASLDLDDVTVTTNGTHANAVFSYGEGTTVNIADSTINTSGNCSGGLMVTGGGTLKARDLAIHTTGNSSAAIRSDRGGGTEVVTGGSYTTDGTGSPVIYSTADVTVSDATLESTASQGVVVEGKNSVDLIDCDLTANNVSKNSDKSEWYQAVMIYQSMSGDAAEGEATFSMEGGSLTNQNGDVLFVNNTVAQINLVDATIKNNDPEGLFLRAAAAGWGSEGSNGGRVTLNAEGQRIDGDMVVDEVSSLNLYLEDESEFVGAINADGAAGEVYVELDDSSTWRLTADSYITSLTCAEGSINLNGHTLYVNGEPYEKNTASAGEAIEVTITSTGGPGGEPPAAPPDGEGGHGPGGEMGGEPPAKPGE